MQKSFKPYGTSGYTSSETANAGNSLLSPNAFIKGRRMEGGGNRAIAGRIFAAGFGGDGGMCYICG